MSETPRRGPRILAAVAAVLTLAAIGAAGWLGYRAVVEQPVKRVVFRGEVERVPAAELEALSQAIRAAPAGSVTLEAVHEAARRVSWVREANVRRQFPDAIEITLRAHEAYARWNDAALLSRTGEVFSAETGAALPRLRGPDGAGPAMLTQHAALAAALAPLGSPIAQLELSPRGAWRVTLDSGLVLELGREDMAARAQRFVAAWPRARERQPQPRHADLRYPNGFALNR